MAEDQSNPTGPDLLLGVAFAELADGSKLLGHVGGDEVLLVRRGTEVFAVAARCTHYHGPLSEGLVVGDTVRCPWHHACFDLRTGEALRAPAFDPLACWAVEQRDGKIFVREKIPQSQVEPRFELTPGTPQRIVMVGGGARFRGSGDAPARAIRGKYRHSEQ